MKEIRPKKYIPHKKLSCDWTDKKRSLFHYRMLKFYITHAMVADKVHEIISFKQSKWSEKYMNFNTQKTNQAVNDFGKGFYKLLNNAFYGTTTENVRNSFVIEFTKRDDTDEIVKQQSKLNFNGIQKF